MAPSIYRPEVHPFRSLEILAPAADAAGGAVGVVLEEEDPVSVRGLAEGFHRLILFNEPGAILHLDPASNGE